MSARKVTVRCAKCGHSQQAVATRKRLPHCPSCAVPMVRGPVEVVTVTCPRGCRNSTVQVNASLAAKSVCACGAQREPAGAVRVVEDAAAALLAERPGAPTPRPRKNKKSRTDRKPPDENKSPQRDHLQEVVDLVCERCDRLARGPRQGTACVAPRCRGRMVPAGKLPSRRPWEREVSGGGGPGTGKRR